MLCTPAHAMPTEPVSTSSITSSLPLPFCSYMCQLSSYSPEPVETNQCWLSAKPEGEPGSQCPSFPAPGYLGADTATPAGGCCTCIWWAFGLPLGCGCIAQLKNAPAGALWWSLQWDTAVGLATAAPGVNVQPWLPRLQSFPCTLLLRAAPAPSPATDGAAASPPSAPTPPSAALARHGSAAGLLLAALLAAAVLAA